MFNTEKLHCWFAKVIELFGSLRLENYLVRLSKGIIFDKITDSYLSKTVWSVKIA